MVTCAVLSCKRRSDNSNSKQVRVSYHKFPKDPYIKEKWRKFCNNENDSWKPTRTSVICSEHFTPESYKNDNNRKILIEGAIPSLRLCPCLVSEQEAQPGPSKALGRRTSLDSNAFREQDPLSGTIEQCRFCGEFNKDCVAVADGMPYLASNKTTLALNDTSVQLDFNNQSLPNTVCRDCDAKLQEFADFVKVVKAAQDTLINVAEEREVGETKIYIEVVRPKVEIETETLVIKTEYDSQDEESDDEKEDKEVIVDSLSVGETVVVKKSVSHKRKSDAVTAKPKKLKSNECDSELMIDIKEEVIEEEDGQGQSGVSDSDVKPSELELATSALVFEMAGDGTSEYQGYESDR